MVVPKSPILALIDIVAFIVHIIRVAAAVISVTCMTICHSPPRLEGCETPEIGSVSFDDAQLQSLIIVPFTILQGIESINMCSHSTSEHVYTVHLRCQGILTTSVHIYGSSTPLPLGR